MSLMTHILSFTTFSWNYLNFIIHFYFDSSYFQIEYILCRAKEKAEVITWRAELHEELLIL